MKLSLVFSLTCLLAVTISTCSPEQATLLRLREPAGVAYDSKGRLIVSDSGNHRLLVFEGEKLIEQIGKEGEGAGEFREPRGIAIDSQGRIVVCDSGNGRIQILGPDLKHVATFGKPSSPGRDAAQSYPALGRESLAGDTDGSAGTLSRPSGVATDDLDNIIVADTWNHRIQIFDSNGKFLRLYDNAGKEKTDMEGFNEPGGVFYDRRGGLFVANGWNSRCDVYDYDSSAQTLKHRGKEKGQIWGFWVCCDVAVNSAGEIVALDTNNGAVCVYPPDFEKDNRTPSRKFTGGLFGSLREPQAVAVGPGDEIAVCDTKNNRVLVLNKNFSFPPRPEILSMAPAALIISWKTLIPATTTLMFRQGNLPGEGEWVDNVWLDKAKVQVLAEKGPPGNHHVVTVGNLSPSTRYWYKLHVPSLRQIPMWGFTQEYAAVTAAEQKTKQFIRLPMAVVTFPNVVNLDSWRADSTPPEVADKERLRYYVEECNKGSRFYWANTRMHLLLDNSFFFDESWYYVGQKLLDEYDIPDEMKKQIKGPLPGYRAVLAEKNLKPQDFCGVVVITAQRTWDAGKRQWVYDGSGGDLPVTPARRWDSSAPRHGQGLPVTPARRRDSSAPRHGQGTYGIRYPLRPAETTFLGGSDIAWLYTHEVGHQIDSYFLESGYDGTFCEWMFNHFAPMMNTAYKHGEHYDGNAWLARAMPTQRFFQLKYGEVCRSADNDDDGIPDDDKRIPLDEVRFRSNPTMVDTDCDGLSDIQEVLASNWIFEMLPAVSNIRADYRIPDPTDPDTDDDGIPDGLDKYPLYVANDTLARATEPPVVDGQIEPDRWSEIYTFTAGEARGTIFGAWDQENLYLAFRFNQEIPQFYFQLDMDDDGWYVGKDNCQVSVSFSEGKFVVSDTWVNNCAESKKWPFRDDRLSKNVKVRLRGGARESLYEVEVAVSKSEELGLDLQAAEVIGFTLNCLLAKDTDKWVSAFEPYRFFEITLAEKE